ncbi:hypothetical protein N7495_006990 [Penicillium taxi]|uniref:uncharacterized protein n=1 Tax=Penicillium taxi TaxID=168475 RepID=UPI0025456AFC|nr:uncharacterized protein N7495_006990 [Penicillium taxi]KAJ5895299.1 hypothetical protein N7495_006990 [Penicillium taxi]
MSSQSNHVNASLSSNSFGATTSTSAVRSRPRRLVSLMDEDDDYSKKSYSSDNDSQPYTSGLSTTILPGGALSRGATPSPRPSRGTSPLPTQRPSRVTEASYRDCDDISIGWNGAPKAFSSSRGAADFLDSSWSSLQSLASSVLGSDMGPATNHSTKTHARWKPSRSDLYISSAQRSTAPAWGPSGLSIPEIGVGTKEERQALVQAKKREALLLADSDPVLNRTRMLRHKRRDSDDCFDQPPDPDHDEDALAYIHHVQPSDSITGVTIKYGCQAAVFRKANGFWPNDNIQSRKIVLLPVDLCTVKGRPIRQESVDLLGPDTEDATESSISPLPGSTDRPTDQTANKSESDANQFWKHESWVQIDGFPAAIEIGRVPRRSLGFFPRTRRKSLSYTDAEPLPLSSAVGSPPLNSSQGLFPWDRDREDSSNSNTARRSGHRRQHSSINLSGGGTGVGTLDLTSTAPGPAMDGLSKFLSQHMPSYLAPSAPPPNLPRNSTESVATVTSNASGLENIGGALEGWVRKVATRAKSGINELQQGSPAQQGGSRGRSIGIWGMGDLIELDDTSETTLEDQRSPSRGPARRANLQSSSSTSSYRAVGSSASAMSRSRAAAFGSGQSERTKHD